MTRKAKYQPLYSMENENFTKGNTYNFKSDNNLIIVIDNNKNNIPMTEKYFLAHFRTE